MKAAATGRPAQQCRQGHTQQLAADALRQGGALPRAVLGRPGGPCDAHLEHFAVRSDCHSQVAASCHMAHCSRRAGRCQVGGPTAGDKAVRGIPS